MFASRLPAFGRVWNHGPRFHSKWVCLLLAHSFLIHHLGIFLRFFHCTHSLPLWTLITQLYLCNILCREEFLQELNQRHKNKATPSTSSSATSDIHSLPPELAPNDLQPPHLQPPAAAVPCIRPYVRKRTHSALLPPCGHDSKNESSVGVASHDTLEFDACYKSQNPLDLDGESKSHDDPLDVTNKSCDPLNDTSQSQAPVILSDRKRQKLNSSEKSITRTGLGASCASSCTAQPEILVTVKPYVKRRVYDANSQKYIIIKWVFFQKINVRQYVRMHGIIKYTMMS